MEPLSWPHRLNSVRGVLPYHGTWHVQAVNSKGFAGRGDFYLCLHHRFQGEVQEVAAAAWLAVEADGAWRLPNPE